MNCFVSGKSQPTRSRQILRGDVSAFGQFPAENNWVAQVTGTTNTFGRGTCAPPVLVYQCANKKQCQHTSLLTGSRCPSSISYRQLLDQRKARSCGTKF